MCIFHVLYYCYFWLAFVFANCLTWPGPYDILDGVMSYIIRNFLRIWLLKLHCLSLFKSFVNIGLTFLRLFMYSPFTIYFGRDLCFLPPFLTTNTMVTGLEENSFSLDICFLIFLYCFTLGSSFVADSWRQFLFYAVMNLLFAYGRSSL